MTPKIKVIKSVKISKELEKKIHAEAKKQRRSAHFLMVDALESAFK